MSNTSTDFLAAFHPEGPWVLTAVKTDRKGIETKTFMPDQLGEVTKWIRKFHKKRNIYFSVNLPKDKLDKKAEREDIHRIVYLHVDLDARVGEPLDEEIERIRALLFDDCPVLQPTFIIMSGGGYQAFWQLDMPVETRGELEAAEEMALYNKQLEIVLGGDNCHNIDRIMRLPGTINMPNAKKVERGRVPVEATLALHVPENIFALSQFHKAASVQMDGPMSATVAVPEGNIERLSSVDDLDKWSVPDRVKVIVVQGLDPDNPKDSDNSRSSWLFDCCCQLVRSDVPDKVIFSILTDPDFGISKSVLDKAPNSERYAVRQIERAKEEVEEPWLRKLNERFAVIGNLGGRCRVIEEVPDHTIGRTRLTKQTFGDFGNRFNNVFVKIGRSSIAVGQWWLRNPLRRQFDYLVFAPGRNPANTYNLWQGFGCSAIPGDKHESYLAHVHDNICSGVDAYYEYLIGWMARTVQKPGTTGQTAVVLRGESGTGKSFFARQFGSVWGRHFLQISDAKHLVGAFNAHLRDCVVLFGDEAFYAGDKKHESVLKTIITEDQMMIEHKGVDAEVASNFVHLIMASNSDWVVPTGPTERRFFVLDVSNEHKQDNEYFRAIDLQMRNGGSEALLHFLLNYDLKGYDVRHVPSTRALVEQKLHSMDPMNAWWLHRLMEGSLAEGVTNGWGDSTITVRALGLDMTDHLKQFGGGPYRRDSAIKLGMFLSKVCPEDWPVRFRVTTGSRETAYRFPPLDELRKFWDNKHSMATGWPKDEEGSVIGDEDDLPF